MTRITPADLVDRLRWFSYRQSPAVPSALLDQSADEIERLRQIVRLVDVHLCDTSLVADLASAVDAFDPDVIRRALDNGHAIAPRKSDQNGSDSA